MLQNNPRFQFLKTISDSSNPFHIIIEDKLSKKLLSVREPIHQSLPYSPTLAQINEDLKRYNTGVTIKSLKVGSDIQSLLSKLPGLPWARFKSDKHFLNHNFTGANTNLDKRLNPADTPRADSIPINRVDLASYHHDLKYRDNKDIENRHTADRAMIEELDKIPNPTFREKVERMLVKKALQAKLALEHGLKENKILAYEKHHEFKKPKYLWCLIPRCLIKMIFGVQI